MKYETYKEIEEKPHILSQLGIKIDNSLNTIQFK